MRVALVDPRGDSAPYDDGLATALAAEGHEVILATCRFRHYDRGAAPGIRTEERFYRLADRLPGAARKLGRGLEHLPDLLALALSLRRRRVDVVHVQWLVLGADVRAWRALARVVGAPLVFTAHNAARAGAFDARQLAAIAAVFDAIVVHSEAGREALVAAGVDDARIATIPHGALTLYRELPAGEPRIPAGPPVAAFLGLIRPYKGLGDLLDAWPSIRARVPDAVLHVAGRPFGEPAADRAVLMGSQGVVCDLRYLAEAELADDLRRADCVVLPYRAIDQSGVLFAALALGRPIVATDVGGPAEVLRGTGAGIVVPPGDPAALAGAVARVLGDEILRDGLAAAARAAADGPYGWPAIARATGELYGRVTAPATMAAR